MLLKRIIPCLDVDRGRVVKGVKYVDHVDAGDPVDQAAWYEREMADEERGLEDEGALSRDDGRETEELEE